MKCDFDTYASQLEYAPDMGNKFHVPVPRNERSRALICRVSVDAYISHCNRLYHGLRALGCALDRCKQRALERQHITSIRARSLWKYHKARTGLEPLPKLMHMCTRLAMRAFDELRPLQARQNTHPWPTGNFGLGDE